MLRTRTYWIQASLALVLTAVLTGCQDKLTHENFSQIRVDVSTQPIVEGLIGQPTDMFADRWFYERPKKHLTVLIDFNDSGYVSRKQWIDAMTATWDDTQPDETDSSTREGVLIERGSR